MKLHPGDKIKFVCDVIGEVVEDPTHSCFTLLVKFGDQIARIPNDGGLSGIRGIRIVKVTEEEPYERC